MFVMIFQDCFEIYENCTPMHRPNSTFAEVHIIIDFRMFASCCYNYYNGDNSHVHRDLHKSSSRTYVIPCNSKSSRDDKDHICVSFYHVLSSCLISTSGSNIKTCSLNGFHELWRNQQNFRIQYFFMFECYVQRGTL